MFNVHESGLNEVDGWLKVGALGKKKGEVINAEDGGDNTGGEGGKTGTTAFRGVNVDVVCVEAAVRHAEGVGLAGWRRPGELTCFSFSTSVSSAIALIFPRVLTAPSALKIG
jgi:hypothetical protein